MAVKLHSAQTIGLKGEIIDVEVDHSFGFRSFLIVGLPDKAVEEARERISYAVGNIGFNPPHKQNQKVIVSLAPADLKKEGPVFDLPIALGYLLASGQIDFDPKKKLFLGELALDGNLRPVKGILSLVRAAKKAGFEEIFVPLGNGKEAGLIDNIKIYEAGSLSDVVEHLLHNLEMLPVPKTEIKLSGDVFLGADFSDIRGQEHAKRALTIAAAGMHNIAMSGPPGTGKTLLAKTLPSILPPLSFDEALEVTAIHSVAGSLEGPFATMRPFRNPHHTSSYVSLVGGGAWPKPGEITLAHRGILFLDEFPEFERRVIESLRQPLEDGHITVSRAKGTMKFPASFMFVAALNPCPCGNLGSKTKMCLCTPSSLFRYQRKISGPISDRIDIWMEVGPVEHEELSRKSGEKTSPNIQKQVVAAHQIQKQRFVGTKILTNSEMGVRDLEKFAPLQPKIQNILNQAAKHMDLSPRAYHRVIKIARTIADLEGEQDIAERHITEALQYRPKQNLV